MCSITNSYSFLALLLLLMVSQIHSYAFAQQQFVPVSILPEQSIITTAIDAVNTGSTSFYYLTLTKDRTILTINQINYSNNSKTFINCFIKESLLFYSPVFHVLKATIELIYINSNNQNYRLVLDKSTFALLYNTSIPFIYDGIYCKIWDIFVWSDNSGKQGIANKMDQAKSNTLYIGNFLMGYPVTLLKNPQESFLAVLYQYNNYIQVKQLLSLNQIIQSYSASTTYYITDGGYQCVCFSQDGTLLFILDNNGDIQTINLLNQITSLSFVGLLGPTQCYHQHSTDTLMFITKEYFKIILTQLSLSSMSYSVVLAFEGNDFYLNGDGDIMVVINNTYITINAINQPLFGCKDGTYYDYKNYFCKQCIVNCLHCNDSFTCSTCITGYSLDASFQCYLSQATTASTASKEAIPTTDVTTAISTTDVTTAIPTTDVTTIISVNLTANQSTVINATNLTNDSTVNSSLTNQTNDTILNSSIIDQVNSTNTSVSTNQSITSNITNQTNSTTSNLSNIYDIANTTNSSSNNTITNTSNTSITSITSITSNTLNTSNTSITSNTSNISNTSNTSNISNISNIPNTSNSNISNNNTSTNSSINNLTYQNDSFFNFTFSATQSIDTLLGNAVVTNFNRVPASRKLFNFIYYYISNFDDLWLYQYHERDYGDNMNNLISKVRNLQQQKWTMVDSQYLITFYNQLNTDQKQFVRHFDGKQDYSGNKFKTVQLKGEGFFVNCWDYFTINLFMVLFMFFMLRIIFRFLFNFKISKVLRPFSFWGYLGLIMVDGNLQFFFFLFFSQHKLGFSFNYFQKMLNILNYFFFFICLWFTFSCYLLFYISYKKLAKYFYDNYQCNLNGIFGLIISSSFKNMTLAAIHNFLRNNYQHQLLSLIIAQILFSLLLVYFYKQSRSFKQSHKLWISISFSILKIILQLALFIQQINIEDIIISDLINSMIGVIIVVYLYLYYVGIALIIMRNISQLWHYANRKILTDHSEEDRRTSCAQDSQFSLKQHKNQIMIQNNDHDIKLQSDGYLKLTKRKRINLHHSFYRIINQYEKKYQSKTVRKLAESENKVKTSLKIKNCNFMTMINKQKIHLCSNKIVEDN